MPFLLFVGMGALSIASEGGCGAIQEFASSFYKSKPWKETRAAFIKSKRGLCEDCLAKGMYTPAKVVHHMTILTPENINDPNITLNWNNLKAVCQDCHAEEHRRKNRYIVLEDGTIITDCPPIEEKIETR